MCFRFEAMKKLRYCWWTKACTTKDDDYPIIYRVLTIPGGCLGFCPSTVLPRDSCISQDVGKHCGEESYLGQMKKKRNWSCAFRDEHEQRVRNKVRAAQPPTRKAIPYPIPSMGLVYLATWKPSKSTIHVGKYTVRPMDGYEKSSPQNFLRKFGARHKMFDDKPGENYVCYPEIAMDVKWWISAWRCVAKVPGDMISIDTRFQSCM